MSSFQLVAAVWVLVSIAAAFYVSRLAFRDTRAPAAALLAAGATLAGAVYLPQTLRDTARAARRFEHQWRAERHSRLGPSECGSEIHRPSACVRTRAMDDVRRVIPAHDRYYVQTRSGEVRFWAFTSLLPRVAVRDPHDAQWIVSFRRDPRDLPLKYSTFRRIEPVFESGTGFLVVGRIAQ